MAVNSSIPMPRVFGVITKSAWSRAARVDSTLASASTRINVSRSLGALDVGTDTEELVWQVLDLHRAKFTLQARPELCATNERHDRNGVVVQRLGRDHVAVPRCGHLLS